MYWKGEGDAAVSDTIPWSSLATQNGNNTFTGTNTFNGVTDIYLDDGTDTSTALLISSRQGTPSISASCANSTAFELVVPHYSENAEWYGAHMYLGVDAGCDILLSEDAGQAGQVLTSAGPNATPYWSNMPKFDYDPDTKILTIS